MKKWLKCEIKRGSIMFPEGINMVNGDKIKFYEEWDDSIIVIYFMDGKKFLKTGKPTPREAWVFMEVTK